MLTEKTFIDLIEPLADGQIQVRQADVVYRDGVEMGRTFTRWVLSPGDDLAEQPPEVKAFANSLWSS